MTGHVVTALAGEVLLEVEVLAVLDVLAFDHARGEDLGETLAGTERWVWEYPLAAADRLTLGGARELFGVD